jgi:leucyl aminopeptidase
MTKRLPALRRAIEDQLLEPGAGANALPVYLVATEDDEVFAKLTEAQRKWIGARNWTPKSGAVLAVPGSDGAIALALLGTGWNDWAVKSPLLTGTLPGSLPPGDYRFASNLPDSELATLAWLVGAYRFDRYKRQDDTKPSRLVRPDGVDRARVLALAEALYFARDLINTPANDFGPAELESAAREIANEHGATIKVTEGSSLLSDNFPMIHAVGRASDRAPRLIDFRWGSEHAPKLTIVGKGICFDTGGLDIKPSSGMALMKKDMGGAASTLALAHLVMSMKLPLRLRVLIPAADNSIAGNAFRPGDVLSSRNGMTVEIGNTDAEGRLVLADALSLADDEAPDWLITIATLTGAARVALGPDLPPLYADDDGFAEGLLTAGLEIGDPLWRMPLWGPYDQLLKSKIADVNHIAEGSHAGSIMAALFLKRFVTKAKRFAHLDIFAWVPREQPGRPQGAEAQAARALFHYFDKEFGL